jgi:calcium-dependent protein kinase
MNTKNDGHLSLKEIEEAEGKILGFELGSKWSDVLKNCDLDGDGRIDFGEFFTAATDHQKYLTEQNIRSAFDLFDRNGDGKIDLLEFRDALPKNARLRNSTIKKAMSTYQSSGMLATKDNSAVIDDDKIWQDILSDVDTNNDGQISFDEFQNAVKSFINESYKI